MKTATTTRRDFLAGLGACAALGATGAAPGPARPLKVLMIGNSFSQSVMRQLPAIAKAMGLPLDLANLKISGCPLSRHWQNAEKGGDAAFAPYDVPMAWTSCDEKDSALRKAAPNGRGNIPQALAAEPWDVVTIQQSSDQSAFYKTYQPYADRLVALIRERAPRAEVRVQETWSYSPYDGRLAKWGLTSEQMYERVHAAYAELAAHAKLKVIPAGTAVQNFRRALPVAYAKVCTKDELAAFAEPARPDFYGDACGLAYWGVDKKSGERRLFVDGAHLNRNGEYLQGCVWAAALFGADVKTCPYRPAFLSDDRAALMRKVAAETVFA